jgi:beta-lactamase regulating signal transducer with metallopeptidase domain
MHEFFSYLIKVNVVFAILYGTYLISFRKDNNFSNRRIILLLIPGLSFLIPMIPSSFSSDYMNFSYQLIPIDSIVVYAGNRDGISTSGPDLKLLLSSIYFTILFFGLFRLIFHVLKIIQAIKKSEKIMVKGHPVFSNRTMHASSFLGYIFIDLVNNRKESIDHILDHELIHSRQMHSIDRLFTELFFLFCWFNPLAWMFRRSVIENHEFQADSAVIKNGVNLVNYQISILNQYIESASITNQFSSHIKKRIKMLNVNHKRGSGWKIAIFLPVATFAFFLIACADQKEELSDTLQKSETREAPPEEIFFIVEEMPTFKGEDPGEFRKYIVKNIIYPKEAAAHGVSGRVYVKFMVNSNGKVVIPDEKTLASAEGVPLDEVVVVSYRPLSPGAPEPEEKYIQMLKDEAVRVVSSSPEWEPGKQRGQEVNVLFTFPIVFALQ